MGFNSGDPVDGPDVPLGASRTVEDDGDVAVKPEESALARALAAVAGVGAGGEFEGSHVALHVAGGIALP
jgi:hypothetical protein